MTRLNDADWEAAFDEGYERGYEDGYEDGASDATAAHDSALPTPPARPGGGGDATAHSPLA